MRNYSKISFLLLCAPLLVACSKHTPQINAVCDLLPNGAYILKWETFPALEGTVRIYESSRADTFDTCSPLFEVPIAAGYKEILGNPFTRSYFKLVFNKKYSTIVARRKINTQGIIGLRDLGGYPTKSHRQVHWGKVFRSGGLHMTTRDDRDLLNNELHIKTVIDLRTEAENDNHPNRFRASNYFFLPLRGNSRKFFLTEIFSGRMQSSEILEYDRVSLSFLFFNNADYFRQLFDILLNPDYYPVDISCFLGKDRSALASILILAALGVDKSTIINDYLNYNNAIVLTDIVKDADMLNPTIQEALTGFYNANRATIENLFAEIEQEYGSIDNYLTKEVKLDEHEREKLRSILLY